MRLEAGKVAVVTGGGSGIGLAISERFARSGLNVVISDVQEDALRAAADRVQGLGVKVLAVPTDVRDESSVQALAAAAFETFGAVHIVCNNAGVASDADPWLGPLSAWDWVLGVNFWGVVHGVRVFLPHLVAQGGGHIVNTASVAGIIPGFSPSYDASKHAVVAITEDLYVSMKMAGLPVGVSVLCPGWVRTGIMDANRNWPGHLGERPQPSATSEVTVPHVRRAVDEGATPASVADCVADAIEAERFWIFNAPEFVDVALDRWHSIAERQDPRIDRDVPGLPPLTEMLAQVQALMQGPLG